jgi:hypothetical protein
MTTAVLIAGGASSAGGLAAVVIGKLRGKKLITENTEQERAHGEERTDFELFRREECADADEGRD